MKKLITFIFLSISVVTYSQEQNKIQIQIDSLKLLKNVYESKIIQIDQTIKELENSKIISAYEEYENMQYTIPTYITKL